MQEIGEIKSDTVKDQIAKQIFNETRAKQYYYGDIRTNLSSQSKYCFENTLTCKKISEMFGYTSGMQGYLIQQNLMKLNLIFIENNRKLFISSKMNSNYHRKIVHNINETDTSFFYSGNCLIKQLPNILIPII